MLLQKNHVFIIFFTLNSLVPLCAQTFAASGGNGSGSGGSISYSLGQIATNTVNSRSGTVTEGIQQTYSVNPIDNLEGTVADLHISIYPNPVNNKECLTVELPKPEKFPFSSYRLINSDGILLSKGQLLHNVTKVSMKDYGSGIYFIQIISKNEVLKTFKIMKN